MTNSIAYFKVKSLLIDIANGIVNGTFNGLVIGIINVITNCIEKEISVSIVNGKANSMEYSQYYGPNLSSCHSQLLTKAKANTRPMVIDNEYSLLASQMVNWLE
jgi:hypothetical protein